MKVEFKVHGIAKGAANVRTDVDGEMLTASVPCVEVELVTVSERSGSLTLRFVGASMEEALKRFTPDSIHTWDLGDGLDLGQPVNPPSSAKAKA